MSPRTELFVIARCCSAGGAFATAAPVALASSTASSRVSDVERSSRTSARTVSALRITGMVRTANPARAARSVTRSRRPDLFTVSVYRPSAAEVVLACRSVTSTLAPATGCPPGSETRPVMVVESDWGEWGRTVAALSAARKRRMFTGPPGWLCPGDAREWTACTPRFWKARASPACELREASRAAFTYISEPAHPYAHASPPHARQFPFRRCAGRPWRAPRG